MKLAAKRAALVLGSTLLSLALAEAVLSWTGAGEPILRDVDPALGWAPIPGAEGWHTREGRAHVRITEHGFRGVDVPPGPHRGVLRVAILGDSYTEAKQVALEEAWFTHAERALDGCAGPAEVLSFGVSGYGTAQELLLLRERVWAWQPDVVLVAFLTGNDVSDNHPALRIIGDPAPTFRLERGALVLDDSFRESAWYRERAERGFWRSLQRRSRLLRLVGGVGRTPRARSRGELGLSDEIYAPPATVAWEEAWTWTEAILARMHAEVAERGARFAVVTLSNAVQVDPDPARRAAHARALGVDGLDYPDARIAALGQRDGFPVLTLVPPLRAHAERTGEHLHGFENTTLGSGHWNARGHRVAGEVVGRFLCAQARASGEERGDALEE